MSRASEFLLLQYNSRKAKNPRFSQRAFARLLGINPGRLTQYFREERAITKTVGAKISEKLGLSAEEQEYFFLLITNDAKKRKNPSFRVLKDDELAMIVEWYHLGLLYLISTADFVYDFGWMSERMGLPENILRSSFERLERTGLIKIENGKIIPQDGPVTTNSEVPSQFLRLAHQDTLRYVADHLDHVPMEKRDLSTITLAIDSKKIPKAKAMVRQFRRKLAGFLSTGRKNEVYMINFQLFPISKRK